jgi:hypothetical protein
VTQSQSSKVPVFSIYGFIEMADTVRQHCYRGKPNVRFDFGGPNKRLRKIVIYPHGDDYSVRSRHGNPQTDVHNAETDINPPRVWTFKRNGGSAAALSHS